MMKFWLGYSSHNIFLLNLSNFNQGCDVKHGRCIAPDVCACDYGWTGPRCSKCITLPGCKHGHCETEAFQCICDDTHHWTGIFCDKRKSFSIYFMS